MIIDEINIKLIVLGLGGVGKTSLVHNFFEKEIPDSENYQPTIGSNIYRRDYLLKDKNIKIRINIWDTGGQRSFNPFNAVIYNDADIVLLVFDLAKPKESIDEIRNHYLDYAMEYASKAIMFLVGNKLDLVDDKEQLKKITQKTIVKQIPLLLLSALTGQNVIDCFDLIIFKYLQDWEKQIKDEEFNELSREFLKFINKKDYELVKLLFDKENVDSLILQKNFIPQIQKKTVPKADLEKEKGLEEYIRNQKQIRELNLIKTDIIYKFTKNMLEIQDLINNLKNTPINILIETIDKSIAQLNVLKEDFELSLDSIINLDVNKIEFEDKKI